MDSRETLPGAKVALSGPGLARASGQKPKADSPSLRGRNLSGRRLPPKIVRLFEALDPSERQQGQTYWEERASGGSLSLCWSEQTKAAKVAAFAEVERLAGLSTGRFTSQATQFLSGGRWDETAIDGFRTGNLGDPLVLTWSIVPDGTRVTGLDGSTDEESDFRSWMASIYGETSDGGLEDQPWFSLIEDAFAAMAATCGVELQYEPRDDGATFGSRAPGVLGRRGDIRLGARFLDGAGGVLGIARGPDQGDLVLDSGDWLFDLTGQSSLRLFNVVTHELGHCLGLAHVCPVDRTKLMEPTLSTEFRGPQFDEFQSLQRLYGDSLERHGRFNANDSPTQATPLLLVVGETLAIPRLSIDDNSDVDFFKIEVLGGQRLQGEVVPGEGSYAEGGESGDACSAGASFDSGMIHDLALELLDRDGATVLREVDREGPGVTEELENFEFPQSGTYFVKVRGGSRNAAQLYELHLTLARRPPGPRLVIGESEILAESGSQKNGRPDPGETLRVRFPFENEGDLTTGPLVFRVSAPEGVRVFDESAPPELAAGEEGFLELVVGFSGACGDVTALTLSLEAGGEILAEARPHFQLGEVLEPVPVAEDFDAARELPAGWQTDRLGGVPEWTTVSSRFDTALRSAFAEGSRTAGDSFLQSPSFELATKGGVLSFRHVYRTEAGFDGGVLEVSRNGGEWVDLLTGYDLEVTGGYDRRLSERFGSSLAGRETWSGRLNTFRSTTVGLPAGWGGEMIQFRWRFAHDRSGRSEGWWVDTVRVTMTVENCVEHRPALQLRLIEGGLDENQPLPGATLQLESELPLVEEVVVPLQISGTAGMADFSGNTVVTLPSGQTEVAIPLVVQVDDLEEGSETLTLAVPEEGGGWVAGAQATVSLSIRDRLDFDSWAQESFGEVVEVSGDRDGDGWSELAEYLLGTDPVAARSRPLIEVKERAGAYLIPLGDLPTRPDAVLGLESSSDLSRWQPLSFQRTKAGLEFAADGERRFLRLTFRLLP